jgi:PPOX class probable F420-dependent enzyme
MSPTSSFDALQRHKYVNVETFRQSGQGVRTPVWFAGDPASGTPQTLYVYSEAESGKAKRIRRNPQVRVAPCDARGNLQGEWIEARAEIVTGEEAQLGMRLLSAKYVLKRVFDVLSKLRGRGRVVFAIRPA